MIRVSPFITFLWSMTCIYLSRKIRLVNNVYLFFILFLRTPSYTFLDLRTNVSYFCKSLLLGCLIILMFKKLEFPYLLYMSVPHLTFIDYPWGPSLLKRITMKQTLSVESLQITTNGCRFPLKRSVKRINFDVLEKT